MFDDASRFRFGTDATGRALMTESGTQSRFDHAAMWLLIAFPLKFITNSQSASSFSAMLIVLLCGFVLWIGMRRPGLLGLRNRFFVALTALLVGFFSGVFRNTQAGFFAFYFVLFMHFSTSQTQWGSSFRVVCGLFASVCLFSSLPFVYGGALSIISILIAVAALISTWSGMKLWPALVWFSKRSIRRETVFLIVFLGGISAIGLRQAQEYASRQGGMSGLSRFLTPGSMQSLILSPALALRISFKRPFMLNDSDLYFRGATMDRAVAFNWVPGPSRIKTRIEPEANDLSYQVALSSRYSEFVPVLDYGVSVKKTGAESVVLSARDNGVFQSLENSIGWVYYDAWSRMTPTHSLDSSELDLMLQLPKNMDGRLRELALSFSSGSRVPEFIDNFGKFVSKNGFEYSLKPGTGSSTASDFIFKSKKGFCEHYASAGALLARAAGIPSRVVTGFLGGQWNSSRSTLYVRELDAHAWVELWDVIGNRWVRFDPVSFVAPDRVNFGAEYYLRSVGAAIPDEGYIRTSLLMSSILMGLDNFISSFGQGSVVSMGGFLIDYGEEFSLLGATGLLISYITLRFRRYRLERRTLDLVYVGRLEQRLKYLGITKRAGEPIDQWLNRVSGLQPNLKMPLMDFSQAFARYRYGAEQNSADLKMMDKTLKSIGILRNSVVRTSRRDPSRDEG